MPLLGLSGSGCYTQLMTPQEFIRSQRTTATATTRPAAANHSMSLNYNQNCVTCHSITELNERAAELEYYGIRTVHDGYDITSRGWNDAGTIQTTETMIVLPAANPYWGGYSYPVNSWWAPNGTTAASSGDRIRTEGATRDGNSERDRTPSVNASSAGGSTSTSTPAPAATPAVTTTTPSQPPQSTDSGRSRDDGNSNSSTGRTRTDGSSRDDGGNRPR